PWGEEAFRRAKTENKPIFLSVGYSSCHWCHVMAHESFESSASADFLNKNFVCIKVDREERPDVDEIYMKAVMSITGSGGWPLTVFLTPSLEPFFGGTYFPDTPRHGMPSFINVAESVIRSWRTERKQIVESASQLTAALKELYVIKKGQDSKVSATILDDCYVNLASSFDEENGGFGGSPKFPTPSHLFFLARYSKVAPSKTALSMLTKTIEAMMYGGIYDQVGGGFHRYSTDRYWIVPHFEKMLYDNALLAQVYIEAYLITKNQDYKTIARETLSWALRELQSTDGGFYSSVDADSPEGEGVYYVWDQEDLKNVFALPGEERNYEIVSRYFSVTRGGNFEGEKTVLTAKSREMVARYFGIREDELAKIIERCKQVMMDFRNKRAKPSKDDKILTSWNGLMISALSKASRAFGDKSYLNAAKSAADLVLKQATGTGSARLKLSRSYKDGVSKGEGVLEDYSFLINGLIDLYEASFVPIYLKNAISICETMLENFQDNNGGGFFLTQSDSANLIVRAKDGYDGAMPSGNSMAAFVCSRLAEFTGRSDFRAAANDTFEAFSKSMREQPSSFTWMACALQFFLGDTKEVVISGNIESDDTAGFLRVLNLEFLHNCVIVYADKRLEDTSPLVEGRLGGKSEVFVCSNYTCNFPSHTPEELISALRVQANSGQ
ncbi:MAG: thioredoxin domain-containing protein, partial [Nitrososphaerota archaeon]|nr:thioredoxin domain-containing protein [Nitrososphaerota archaeon]